MRRIYEVVRISEIEDNTVLVCEPDGGHARCDYAIARAVVVYYFIQNRIFARFTVVCKVRVIKVVRETVLKDKVIVE